MSKYLTPESPSYGCDQAWFLFAVKNHRGPGICRLILVEAASHAAVAFLERVSTTGAEPAVSDTVLLMSVHRQCPTIGIRSSMLEEVDFRTFANDIVDRRRVDRDPLAVQAYREAVSPSKPSPVETSLPSADPARQELIDALSGLGFRKPEAESMAAALGDLQGRPVEDLIRLALRSRKSTAS